MVAVLAGCAAGPWASPTPSAVTQDAEFVLAISTPKHEWASNEAIEVQATLSITLTRPEASSVIWGSGGGIIAFEVVELTGTRRMDAVRDASCVRYSVSPSTPIEAPYAKSGTIDPGDPNEAFYRDFFNDPLFHLPAGRWRITAWASLTVGECGGRPVDMRASLEITVR